MSGTEYARQHTLRMTEEERAVLEIVIMQEIEDALYRPADGTNNYLRILRSLLERLTD
jgi:hypothetical protein